MLAVDVQQQFPERFELLHRYGIAVDECAGAPVCRDDSTQQAGVVLVQGLVLEPVTDLLQRRDIEFGAEFGAPGAAANELAAAALAKHEAHGIDENRLAGPGLAGENGHAGLELDLDLVDDGEVANLQPGQHQSAGPNVRIRLSRPQSSLERRMP